MPQFSRFGGDHHIRMIAKLQFEEINRTASDIEQQIDLRAALTIVDSGACNAVVASSDTKGMGNIAGVVPGQHFEGVATPGFIVLMGDDGLP